MTSLIRKFKKLRRPASKVSRPGLQELTAPEGANIDIVFVHGLFGNRINSWSADNGVFWPKALLSQDIPDARILTFGYDADVTKFNLSDELTEGTMETYAADLCDRLSGLRANTDSTDRPLVFVAHSLGGLVCAQLAVRGALAAEPDNVAVIANNIRGMVFLGTPFHGSPVASLAGVFSSMLSVLHKTHTQKVKDLQQRSEKLQILGESFATVLHQRIRNNKEIRVAFFHEMKKLCGVLVVPMLNSRIIGFGDHASINADHSAMCKFTDSDDPGYHTVVAAIKKMATAASMENESNDIVGNPPPSTDFNHVQSSAYHYVNKSYGTVKNQVIGTQTIHGGMHFA